MGRHGPPWKDAITYFRWDAKDWVKQHTVGWSTADMNTTIDTLWHLLPHVQAHYNNSRTTNPLLRPGLPAPNPIPAHPYSQADLTNVLANGQLPQPSAPVPAPVPGPVPVPAPVPALGGAAHMPAAAGRDAETQAAQVNTTDLLYLPDLRTASHELPPILEVSDAEEDEKKRKAMRTRRKRKFEKAGLGDPGREGSTNDWRYMYPLGSGSTGIVTLWVDVDESRVIVERLAVRDVVVAPDV